VIDPTPAPPEGGPGSSPIVRRARVGEPIEVSWPARPSSGYRWECDPLPEGILLRAERYEPDLPALPGRGGVQRFRLEPAHAGRFTVRFRYRRPWEPNEVEARELQVIVEPVGSAPGRTGSDPG